MLRLERGLELGFESRLGSEPLVELELGLYCCAWVTTGVHV